MSSSIGSFSISDNTCTFSGECTINRNSGYSFEATITDANPDEISISVTGPDEFSYSFSGTLVGGDIAVSTDTGGGGAPLKLPEETQLLQNYPNPFNPDTWIPFKLSKDSDVTIEIYDIAGRLIRELQLGYIPAGSYVARDMAAYWDGRNEAGGPVASGIYFYTIQAGEFTATRKMAVTL